jgi:DNA polymerase-3 subunit beta
MKEKTAVKKVVILKVAGHGQIKADPGSKPAKVLASQGFDPKKWVIGEPEEKATTITYRVTENAAEKGAEVHAPDLPEPPKMKTVYGDIEGSPKLCPKCNGYYPGETCPKCAAESETEHIIIVEPLTGARLDTPAKEEPFEPVLVKLSVKEMLAALRVVVDITDQKGIMPILGSVKIASASTETVISATNLERSWQRTVTSTGGDVVRCVPARVLFAEIKALPADTVDLELLFKAHTVSVNGRCDIATQDAEEFPELNLPSGDMFFIGNLVNALKRVMPAVSTDETRYALTGVYFDFKDSKLIGTDGHRLHIEDIELEGHVLEPAIVPLASAKIIAKHGSDAVRWVDERHLCFPLGGGVFSTRVIEGAYPDWKTVVPNPENVITFNPDEFLKIVEGANVIDNQRIALTVNGNLSIESEGCAGAYKWQIPCGAVLKSKLSPICFNPKYLTDAIKAFPMDRVTLQAPEGYGACLLNEKAVVMPIRV